MVEGNLKLLLQHIPDRGEHLVRYYGWYSNRSRGDHKGSGGTASDGETDSLGQPDSDQDHLDPEYTKAARSAWARLIKKVYEVDPLKCPHCGGEMRFLSVIEEAPVIERILRHIRAWDPSPPLRAPPSAAFAESKFLSLYKTPHLTELIFPIPS